MKSVIIALLILFLGGLAQAMQSDLDDGAEWIVSGSEPDGSRFSVNFQDGMTGNVVVSSDGHWVEFLTPTDRYFEGSWGNKTTTIGAVTINGSRSDGRETLVIESRSLTIEVFDGMVGGQITENTTGQFFDIKVVS